MLQNLKNRIADFLFKTSFYKNIVTLMCFFAGRLVFFKTLNPFVTAYLSVFLGTKQFPFACLLSILGLATISAKIYTFRYFSALSVLSVINFVLTKKGAVSRVKRSVMGGVSLLIGGSIYAATQWFSPYYFTIAVLEALLTGFLCYVLYSGVALVCGQRGKKTISSEEALSLAVMVGGILPGMNKVYVFSIPIVAVAATLIVIETIKRSGSVAGISAAALTGMFMYFTGMYKSEIVSVLVLAATGAALFSKTKRLAPIGFAMGASTAFFAYRDIADWNYATAVAVGCAVSCILPSRLYLAINENVTTGVEQAESCALQLRHICVRRMREFSAVLERIIKISERTGVPELACDEELAEKTAEMVCTSCKMREFCWQNEDAMPVITNLINEVRCGTKYLADTLPSDFSNGCRRVYELCATAEKVYDEAMLDNFWQKKMAHSKQLMTAQLKNASELAQRLCKDIGLRMNRDDELSNALYSHIYEKGVRGVSVCGDEVCRDIFVTMYETVDNAVVDEVVKAVETCMKRNFYIADCENDRENSVTQLHIREKPIYKIAAYATDETKGEDEISGDCHTYMNLDGGRYLLALADGMGTGDKAREESAASIEMYEDFMEAGFDRGVTLDIINSVLLIRDGYGKDNDKFSTLDICTIDLYTGKAEFVKIGAVATFIIRNGKAETIRSSTLPVGILNEVDTDIYERTLQKDDIVLMMTDGVLDSVGSVVGNENWIIETIENTSVVTPKSIADKILEVAKKNSRNVIKDDMTVLAAKIY